MDSCQDYLKVKLEKFRNVQLQPSKFKNANGQYIKEDFFYEVASFDISLNPLQKNRFETSKEGSILLFENNKRQEIIKKIILEISKKDFQLLCLTGPQGVGKSHTLALLSLYLRNKIYNSKIYKIVAESKFRILYFNNPYYYVTMGIAQAIQLDLISFFGEDLGKDFFKKITDQFLKISYFKIYGVIAFIEKVVKLYEANGYMPLLFIDQINVLHGKKSEDKIINDFFRLVQSIFHKIILSASNTDEKLNNILDFEEALEFHSKNFFENDNDFKKYVKKLGYFKNHEVLEIVKEDQKEATQLEGKKLTNAMFLEAVIEITGKHPYEIMKLNRHYTEINWDENNQEEQIEELKEKYMKDRKIEFLISHEKFIKEKLKNKSFFEIYFQIIAYMDSNVRPIKLSNSNFQFMNKNFMEIDEEMKITSLCPAAKIFLDEFLITNKEADKDSLKESLNTFLRSNQNGELFQRLCDQFLVDRNLKKLKLISNLEKPTEIDYSSNVDENKIYIVPNLKEVLNFIGELCDKLASQKNILIIIQDFYFDLIEYVYIDGKCKDIRNIYND